MRKIIKLILLETSRIFGKRKTAIIKVGDQTTR